MIKFETIDGTLCRMVDKPVPLTLDSKIPCLVRLIQDDSRMGMFNRDTKPSRLSDFYLVARIVSNNIVVDEFMESDYSRFEIIGYPVEEGSKEWALYQIKSGKKVVKEGDGELYGDSFYKNRLFYLNGYDCLVTENAIGFIDPCSEVEFLNLDETGWQIYEPEPEQPKYKVGDWVEIQWDDNSITHEQIVKVRQHEFLFQPNERCCYTAIQMDTMKHESMNIRCIRKLSPSEVVVHIGCLSGTIKDLSYAEDGRFWFIGGKTERCPGRMHCILYLEMLDTNTRSLVESLLEAMQEEE